MIVGSLLFIGIIVVALGAFAGVVYLIVRVVNRGDSIAVEPGAGATGSDPESTPPS